MQKLQAFVDWLKTHDCIVDAQIQCVSCVETLPEKSEVYITFKRDGQAVTRSLCISMGEILRLEDVHEVEENTEI